MIHNFLEVHANAFWLQYLKKGTLKKHLETLLSLERQEKVVENEIEKLKDKIYLYCIFSYCPFSYDKQKMPKKGLKMQIKMLLDNKRLHLLKRGGLHSTPFGNLEKENEGMLKTDDIKGNIAIGNGHSNSNTEKRSIDNININPNTMRNIRNLSSFVKKSDSTRSMDWRIENHGKQTIILL